MNKQIDNIGITPNYEAEGISSICFDLPIKNLFLSSIIVLLL